MMLHTIKQMTIIAFERHLLKTGCLDDIIHVLSESLLLVASRSSINR